jgi:hypothetical protein
MKYFKSLGLCLVAVFALSALAASAAQAEENKGPLWIVGSPAKGLKAGETRAIKSKAVVGTIPILRGTAASIECEKATTTGFLLGGSPGTDVSTTKFEKCNVVGQKNCLATGLKPVAAANAGEIRVDVYTILAFAKGSTTSAVDLFAPQGETGKENLFSEFELLNKVGASTELCNLLNKQKVVVEATGTALKIKGVTRKAGQIGEVGRINAGAFSLTTFGETAMVGLLRFGKAGVPVKEAELYNTEAGKEKYELIKAELNAGALGTVFEEATLEIETNPAEAFGWNY